MESLEREEGVERFFWSREELRDGAFERRRGDDCLRNLREKDSELRIHPRQSNKSQLKTPS